LRGG